MVTECLLAFVPSHFAVICKHLSFHILDSVYIESMVLPASVVCKGAIPEHKLPSFLCLTQVTLTLYHHSSKELHSANAQAFVSLDCPATVVGPKYPLQRHILTLFRSDNQPVWEL